MDAASRLRIQSISQLTDVALHSSTQRLVTKPARRILSQSLPQVFRDIKLSHPLMECSSNDMISDICQDSIYELSHSLSIIIPPEFQNDSHVMNTCANILRHRKTYLNSSLLHFVVGVLMSQSELLSKTIKYFQKSLESQPDLRFLFENRCYPPSEGLTRKVHTLR